MTPDVSPHAPLPLAGPGTRIGLLGGSFNPAHEGHLHLSRMALRALGLHQVWWLVSPQNPLKAAHDMPPVAQRTAQARVFLRTFAHHMRIIATDLESGLGTRYTVDTVRALTRRRPDLRFVWLMGADNLLQLRRWKRWTEIVETLPIAVYPRPGFSLRARLSPAAVRYRWAVIDPSDARFLPDLAAPALVFLQGPEHPASATALRAGR